MFVAYNLKVTSSGALVTVGERGWFERLLCFPPAELFTATYSCQDLEWQHGSTLVPVAAEVKVAIHACIRREIRLRREHWGDDEKITELQLLLA